jgi:hypothetical protein
VVRELVSMFMESRTKYMKETPVLAPGLFKTDLMKELPAGQADIQIQPAADPFATDPAKDLAELSRAPLGDNKTPGIELDLADEARLEVLDPASLPEAPAWPPQDGIIAGGLLARMLLAVGVGYRAALPVNGLRNPGAWKRE